MVYIISPICICCENVCIVVVETTQVTVIPMCFCDSDSDGGGGDGWLLSNETGLSERQDCISVEIVFSWFVVAIVFMLLMYKYMKAADDCLVSTNVCMYTVK